MYTQKGCSRTFYHPGKADTRIFVECSKSLFTSQFKFKLITNFNKSGVKTFGPRQSGRLKRPFGYTKKKFFIEPVRAKVFFL